MRRDADLKILCFILGSQLCSVVVNRRSVFELSRRGLELVVPVPFGGTEVTRSVAMRRLT